MPECANGTLLQGREGNVSLDSGFFDEFSTIGGLDVPGIAQGTIVPTGELVGEVPRRFSVSYKNQCVLFGLLGRGVAATEGGARRQKRTGFNNGKHGAESNVVE